MEENGGEKGPVALRGCFVGQTAISAAVEHSTKHHGQQLALPKSTS
jgi:hypothetical protein